LLQSADAMTIANHDIPVIGERDFEKDAIVVALTQPILRCTHLSLP
jgi:hypothetical protein